MATKPKRVARKVYRVLKPRVGRRVAKAAANNAGRAVYKMKRGRRSRRR